jgi:hypothetical protein
MVMPAILIGVLSGTATAKASISAIRNIMNLPEMFERETAAGLCVVAAARSSLS